MHVAEAGRGEPVLLLHGCPQHWWAWRKVVPGLAEHYRVIAPDLRGAGWTDAPPGGYGRDQLVDDVINLMDALHLDRVCLIGYDWGGILGFRLCLFHPERVRRFVAMAAPHPYVRFHARMLVEMWRLWPMFAIATPVVGPRLLGGGKQRFARYLLESDALEAGVWSAEDLDLFLSRLREPARARAASAIHRRFVLREANRTLAGAYRSTRLRTPTLMLRGTVLYGGDDPAVLPEYLRVDEDHADDLTHGHVPGASYYIPEQRPDVVVERALEFFARP